MPFYYHPRMLAYDFGANHPLKPERLRRTIELLGRLGWPAPADPGPGSTEDVLRVHSPDYVKAVRALGQGGHPTGSSDYGFGSLDNPVFAMMHEAALAYVSGTAAAARDVAGGAPLAINLSGGLHHAQRSRASGFCVYNDPAIAISILRESSDRVAYIDIDVHAGDGVQALTFHDPSVLTCSIHQDPRTIYPGTGFVEEIGAEGTAVNVPLPPGTTGDIWLRGIREGVLPYVDAFQPGAVVLQMGTDAHFTDPLARFQVTASEWIAAIGDVASMGIPVVAVGGGGYSLSAVPRMWAATCFTLAGLKVPDIPSDLQGAWDLPNFFDDPIPEPRGVGEQTLDVVLATRRALQAVI
ncbi:MAG TPA: acetoin utilization protein AcuC [Fimbriimonadaceae bacterium]|nr:acetoin utilization protein AcuC [Fimbriimonadaceae bacterium]